MFSSNLINIFKYIQMGYFVNLDGTQLGTVRFTHVHTISSWLQFAADHFKSSSNAVMACYIKWHWLQPLTVKLLQFRLTLLCKASSKHVTSKWVQTLGQCVTKAAVAPSYEYVSVRIVTNSQKMHNVIHKLVEKIDAKQNRQRTQHQCHILQMH